MFGSAVFLCSSHFDFVAAGLKCRVRVIFSSSSSLLCSFFLLVYHLALFCSDLLLSAHGFNDLISVLDGSLAVHDALNHDLDLFLLLNLSISLCCSLLLLFFHFPL